MALPNAVRKDPGADANEVRSRPVPLAVTVLTPEQAARRRRRNIAIGLTVGFMALLFYVVTIVKLGPGVLNRPM